jgi:hypothetical protein
MNIQRNFRTDKRSDRVENGRAEERRLGSLKFEEERANWWSDAERPDSRKFDREKKKQP